MASEARQVDMGISAASEFQPSQYSLLLKVTHPVGSATPVKPCMACHTVPVTAMKLCAAREAQYTPPWTFAPILAKRHSISPLFFNVQQLMRFLTLQIKCVQHVAGCPMSSGTHIYLICEISCKKGLLPCSCQAYVLLHRQSSEEQANVWYSLHMLPLTNRPCGRDMPECIE